MKEKTGEMIDVSFDIQEHRYVRGHVSREAAISACAEFGYPDAFDEAIEHAWARSVPDSTGEYGFRFIDAKAGRGAYMVTKLCITKAREAREYRERVREQLRLRHSALIPPFTWEDRAVFSKERRKTNQPCCWCNAVDGTFGERGFNRCLSCGEPGQ